MVGQFGCEQQAGQGSYMMKIDFARTVVLDSFLPLNALRAILNTLNC
jgi:hypothetical protein